MLPVWQHVRAQRYSHQVRKSSDTTLCTLLDDGILTKQKNQPGTSQTDARTEQRSRNSRPRTVDQARIARHPTW